MSSPFSCHCASRRRWLQRLAALPLGAGLLHQLAAHASTEPGAFPSQPVRFVVPYAPGGTSDVLARLLGQKLGERWGRPVLVDNKPGAGTVIGASSVKQASDGHSFLLANNTHVISPLLMPGVPYDALADFTPICPLATSDYLLLASPRLGVKTFADFLKLARSRPGKLNFGTHGVGGLTHLAAELLSGMAGIRMEMVQYKGAGPALTAMLGGEVDIYFDAPATTLPYVEQGKLVALATSGTRGLKQLPRVPTIADAGVPGYDVTIWYGLLGPARLPDATTAQVQSAVQAVLNLPEVQARMDGLGVQPFSASTAEFGRFLQREQLKYARIVKERGIKMTG
jgi:tripartite-type tricarboxylate transporter receptor subunit TctC